MKRSAAYLFSLLFSIPAFAKTTEVTIGILQPNLAEETEYSPIYRMGFEAGLFYNLGRTNDRLEKCGYTARYSFSYYPHGDQAIIRTKAESLEKEGAPVPENLACLRLWMS